MPIHVRIQLAVVRAIRELARRVITRQSSAREYNFSMITGGKTVLVAAAEKRSTWSRRREIGEMKREKGGGKEREREGDGAKEEGEIRAVS